nr:AT-rich interactive domain-containing protein 4B isoform X1 [Onthophagus taurus]
MQGDDPPYLSEGTAVSAKYKGAFCEAKVSKVVRLVKCKVTFKMGLGTATVHDDNIKGTLRVGQIVQAKHPEKKEFFDATITKVQDCSQYTVVFDDGDITTLKRTALCLKSGRHFNESETLDQLPLTHPEHFGNPVVGGRRGRRNRQLNCFLQNSSSFREDSSEGEQEEDNEPDLELYTADIGRVVSVESSEKKRNKDNWFPGLIVMPSAQPTVKINMKDEFLVRSFKDGRYYTVPKKEVTEFTKELGAKVENSILAEAVEKALKYLNEDSLPDHWEKSILFNPQNQYTDSEENFTDSSDDEPREEKDHFVAQLYKFMDDSGTPLNKSPMIGSKDVDLYRLFRVVHKIGGYNRVTNQNKWRTVGLRLKYSNNQNTFNQVKAVYKKCLYSYESFYRTLGCTMSDHTRSSKKNRGRPLIRDKDRVTPVQSPRPDSVKEEIEEKKEEIDEKDKDNNKLKVKKEEKKKNSESSDQSISENIEIRHSPIEPVVASTSKEVVKVKKPDTPKPIKEKKGKIIEKIKEKDEKKEKEKEKEKEREKEKEKDEKSDKEERTQQSTRTKFPSLKAKEAMTPERKIKEKMPMRDAAAKNMALKAIKKDERRGRKRVNSEEKSSHENTTIETIPTPLVNVGDKLMVYYGPTHDSKVATYEAKVIEIGTDSQGPIYMVHYTGWNTRYDEWIPPQRIAENVSVSTKAKRIKQSSNLISKSTTSLPNSSSTPTTKSLPSKRGRGTSFTGKTTTVEPTRSTTPSSVTSSSSRTKSPATPATRNRVNTRHGESTRRTRRTSVQTDISMHSDSDSESSECDGEQSRNKNGGKSEDCEVKTPKKRLIKTKLEKRKDDDDTEKEDEEKPKKPLRKLKKTPEVIKPSDESDEDSSSHPKGRDFDLNQIRSELKGFTKIKMTETSEKDTSSDDSTPTSEVKVLPDECDDKKEKIESTSSSEDIYEFKEPEPFEFESPKTIDEKNKKRFVPRVLEPVEKSPRKKSPKSKVESKEDEKIKKFRRTPKKDEDDDEDEEKIKDEPDPFDKLVESPSFHIGKSTEKVEEKKIIPKVLNMDLLFKELPSSIDESDERLDISDAEDTSEPLFSNKGQLFAGSFSKPSPNHGSDPECTGFTTKSDDRKTNTSDDEEIIKTTMKNVLEFDNDSNDLLSQPSEEEDAIQKDETITLNRVESEDEMKPDVLVETVCTQEKLASLSRQIAPVFQETDSALLRDLYSQQFLTTKVDDVKDINYKIGTKVADSILQKLNKNIKEVKKDEEIKEEVKPIQEIQEIKEDEEEEDEEEEEEQIPLPEVPKSPEQPKLEIKMKEKPKVDVRKSPRKAISKEFIDESDSDSSDSEERLIMDEDSQTSLSQDINKFIKDQEESSSKPETETIETEPKFNFDVIKEEVKEEKPEESCSIKEEDGDPDALLYCGETLPGSPAPAPSTEPKQKTKSELPFASVPCSSSSSNSSCSSSSSSTNNKVVAVEKPGSSNNVIVGVIKERNVERPPQIVLPVVPPVEIPEIRDAAAVLDNTPPTTPESTISNLSPRRENCDLSPNTADNDSCKSTEAEVESNNQRKISTNSKVSPFSEEDTIMNSEQCATSSKKREDVVAGSCRKRRRSCKGGDDVVLPVKRGRKPLNRSRHNSDSDDNSEHSAQGNGSGGSSGNGDGRLSRSPKPSKYNFCEPLDPSLDCSQRIAVLQQKLADVRKTYADIKAELATIERRRKRLRRREREAAKAAKQEATNT